MLFINKTSIGNNIAALIEPSETILVSAINTSPKTKQISPICQFVVSNTPTAVATPLPPLNLKNTGNVCPIITNIPASCISNGVLAPLAIFPISNASNIATTPFNISQTNVIAAAAFPTVLNILVVPAFPLPFSLTSNPATLLLIITEKLILPIKYAIIAIIIYGIIIISSFYKSFSFFSLTIILTGVPTKPNSFLN